jgi:hypothetical protein
MPTRADVVSRQFSKLYVRVPVSNTSDAVKTLEFLAEARRKALLRRD